MRFIFASIIKPIPSGYPTVLLSIANQLDESRSKLENQSHLLTSAISLLLTLFYYHWGDQDAAVRHWKTLVGVFESWTDPKEADLQGLLSINVKPNRDAITDFVDVEWLGFSHLRALEYIVSACIESINPDLGTAREFLEVNISALNGMFLSDNMRNT